MKARLIRDMVAADDAPEEWVTVNEEGVRICPAGLEFEHPEAHWQVRMGNAVSVDDECERTVSKKRSKPELEVARQAMDELLELEKEGLSLMDDEDDEDEGDDE